MVLMVPLFLGPGVVRAETPLGRLIQTRNAAAGKIREQLETEKTISFFPYRPEEGDVPAPVTFHAPSCAKLFVDGPTWDGNPDIDIKVDGSLCASYLKVSLGDKCKRELNTPGKHEVTVEVFARIWYKTGNQETRAQGAEMVVSDHRAADRGKRITSANISCGKDRHE